MYSCQLPQNVLRGCCGCWLLSLNNRLCFNISYSLEDITGLPRSGIVQLATMKLSDILQFMSMFILPVGNISRTFRRRQLYFRVITDLITDHIAVTSPVLWTQKASIQLLLVVSPCCRHPIQPKHTSSYVEPSIMYRVSGIRGRSTVTVELFYFSFGSDGAPNAQRSFCSWYPMAGWWRS